MDRHHPFDPPPPPLHHHHHHHHHGGGGGGRSRYEYEPYPPPPPPPPPPPLPHPHPQFLDSNHYSHPHQFLPPPPPPPPPEAAPPLLRHHRHGGDDGRPYFAYQPSHDPFPHHPPPPPPQPPIPRAPDCVPYPREFDHPSPSLRRPAREEVSPREFWGGGGGFERARARLEWEQDERRRLALSYRSGDQYIPESVEAFAFGRKRLRRAQDCEVEEGLGIFYGTARGGEGDVNGWQPHALRPSPPMWSSAHSYNATNHVSEKNVRAVFDARLLENDYFASNKGKRKMPTGGMDAPVSSPWKRPPKKLSALSRIQSGISVWNRIEEKPSASSSPPLLPAQPPQFSPTSFSYDNQSEFEGLDLSFKSDALVAKVLVSPSALATSFNKGSPNVRMTKKKVTKAKKVVKKSHKVVFPVVSDSPGSSVKEGTCAKRGISISPIKCLNHSEETEKAVSSSAMPVEVACPKPSSENVKKMPETSEMADIEKTAADECTSVVDVVKDSRCNEEDSNADGNPILDIVVYEDTNTNFLDVTNEEVVTVASPNNDTAESSSKVVVLFDNLMDEDYQISKGTNECENAPHRENAFDISVCSSFASGIAKQDITLSAPLTSISSVNYLEDENTESKRQRDETHKLEAGMVMNDFASIEKGKSMISLLEVKDTVMDQDLYAGSFSGEDNSIRMHVKNVTASSDYLMSGDYIADVSNLNVTTISGVEFAHDFPNVQAVLDCVNVEEEQPFSHIADNTGCNSNDNASKLPVKPISNDIVLPSVGFISKEEESMNTGRVMLPHFTLQEEAKLLTREESKTQITLDSKTGGREESNFQDAAVSSSVRKILPSRMSLANSHVNQNVRHRTWHRDNTLSSASSSHGNLQHAAGSSFSKLSPRKFGKLQSSYIRKGNSLIRKSATKLPLPHSSLHLAPNRSTNHAVNKSPNFENRTGYNDNAASSNPSFERPKTPPLPLATKLAICSTDTSEDASQPFSESTFPMSGVEEQVNQIIKSANNSEPSSRTGMVYVKRKSNQLVAAPVPKFDTSSNRSLEKNQFPSLISSDLYYKKKKNQLILNSTPSESQNRKDVLPADSSKSDDHSDSVAPSLSDSQFKKKLDKAPQKTNKVASFSHVWTLSGRQPQKNAITTINHAKILPQLFPWKRTTNWKNSVRNRLPMLSKSSLSLISRNLLVARKRDMIYKRSTDGFSIRKAGVLGIGGSSLKWSRSIERRSKKVNKEATLVVAEVERKKREKRKRQSLHKSEKGLCTNTSCPYRHVKVHSNASICDGFLRGYCADGDECRKKHSYVCPLFESNGECPQGSKCKLHHPKRRNKHKRRKTAEVQSNSTGRYFGSTITSIAEPLAISTVENDTEDVGELLFSSGQVADYIGLDVADGEGGTGCNAPRGFEPIHANSDCLDLLPMDNLDAFMKPIRIMRTPS
ncbi:Zinc finger CCCH domain-containing protein 7 [Ananas comosus]|uniref:Zinc finger CCCH domain-containing protein 7 n=1 Tax=Ananas comosus TaxID=4615 RepID=A0A199ULV2_ANACO|nr:Zinc finger CCCH domain-containing protein 7 [Ananas comosus]